MSLDKTLCINYIGRDEAFWQKAQQALDTARAKEGAASLLARTASALLDRHDAAEGCRLLTEFARLTPEAGPMAPVGALGEMLPRALEFHRAQGATDAILKDTYSDLLRWVNWFARHHGGQDGVDELCWVVLPYAGSITKLGCLQYEVIENRLPVQAFVTPGGGLVLFACGGVYVDETGHGLANDVGASFITGLKQSSTSVRGHLIDPRTGLIDPAEASLPTEGLRCILHPGDKALTLHIPAGTSLRPEDVDSSLRMAREYFAAAGMPFSICQCHSWMLDSQLDEILAPSSNIRNLARRFARIAMPGKGSVARFVFQTDVPFQSLPPEAVCTSLQKAVFQRLKAGVPFHDFGGVMLL